MSRLSSLPPLAAASMQCTACDGSTGRAPVAAFLKEARYAVEVLDVWCAIDVHWTFTITIDGPSELEFSCSLSPNASLVGIEMVAADGYTVRGVVERTAQAAEHFDDAVAAGHTAALVQLDPTAERLKFSVSRVTAPTDVTIVLHLACELSRSVQLHRPATADDGAAIESVRVMLPGSPLASGDAATHPAFPERLSVNVHSAHSIVRVALDAKSAEGWRESQPATVLEAGTQATAAWERSADVRRHLTPALLIETAPTSPISPLLGTSRGWNAIDCDSEQQAQHLCLVLHRPYLDVTSTSPLYTELVFLVDLSGSMMGTNLDAARAALLACLETLRTFAGRNVLWNLVVFGSKHKRLFTTSRSVDDLEALESGEQYARSMTASMGGTVLLPPLSEICMAPVGEHSRQIFIITDGQVENEHEIIRFVRQQSAVRIFAYGIGNGVSSTLVRALGRQGVGSDSALLPSSLLAHSANGSELQSLVRNQLLEAMTPALLRLSISFTNAGHDETLACDDITPSPLTPLYAGSCSVVYARVAKGTIATSPSAKVRGYDAQRGEWVEFAVPISHRVPTTAHQLERLVGTLAAARRIRQLEELAFEDGSQLAGEEIERLGVRYQLATSRTSFVAIEERLQQAATGALELVRAGMPVARPPQPPPSARAPVCLTSAVNWRAESLRYKRNEYFLDIAELQSVIMLARDASLVCHSLKGSIKAKCMLSGMPEVRIHFNEPLQHLFRVGYARYVARTLTYTRQKYARLTWVSRYRTQLSSGSPFQSLGYWSDEPDSTRWR